MTSYRYFERVPAEPKEELETGGGDSPRNRKSVRVAWTTRMTHTLPRRVPVRVRQGRAIGDAVQYTHTHAKASGQRPDLLSFANWLFIFLLFRFF
jgi:hypothetical protein